MIEVAALNEVIEAPRWTFRQTDQNGAIEMLPLRRRSTRSSHAAGTAPGDHARPPAPGKARLFVSAGHDIGLRPGDVVGAIANECDLSGADIGPILISERFTLVEIPDGAAGEVDVTASPHHDPRTRGQGSTAIGSAMNLTAPMAPHHVDHDEATTVSAIAATVALGEVKTVSASAQNARTTALGRPTASLQVPRSRIAKAHVHADRRRRW